MRGQNSPAAENKNAKQKNKREATMGTKNQIICKENSPDGN